MYIFVFGFPILKSEETDLYTSRRVLHIDLHIDLHIAMCKTVLVFHDVKCATPQKQCPSFITQRRGKTTTFPISRAASAKSASGQRRWRTRRRYLIQMRASSALSAHSFLGSRPKKSNTDAPVKHRLPSLPLLEKFAEILLNLYISRFCDCT